MRAAVVAYGSQHHSQGISSPFHQTRTYSGFAQEPGCATQVLWKLGRKLSTQRRLNELLASLGSQATPAQQLVQSAFADVEDAASTTLDWDISGDYLRKGRVALEDGEEVELEMDDLEAEDERGEFAPEVVELDETGKQRGLVSWSD